MKQLEWVLMMGMSDPFALFEAFGLDEAQISRLQAREQLAQAEMDQIESRRAVRSEDGSALDVSPFPQERIEWLKAVERDVADIVGEEQAPVVARAILARSGVLEKGLYRLHIELQADGRISEQSFELDGSLYREDVHIVSERDLEKWGDLLPVGTTR